jgi:hypothetical protein
MALKSCGGMVVAAMALMTGQAFAQTVSCDGLGLGAPWMGGAPAASDIATAAGALSATGVVVPPDGRAVSLFSVSRAMDVRVEAAPQSGAGDTVLEVYDADGRLVVLDDDSGGGLSSRAELDLQPGNYCLAVRGFDGGAMTADLRVSRLDMPALTVGLAGGFAGTEGLPLFVGVQPCLADTPATPLGAGPIDGQLALGVVATNSVTAVPYYRFALAAPQTVSVRAENPNADPYIYVFDGAGALLDENDDFETLNSRIDFTTALPPGSYCIGMRALSDPDQPVTVSVRGFDQAAVDQELYAAADAAPPLGGAYPVTDLGVLPATSLRDVQVPGGRAVFYSFEITQAGLLLITADEVTDSDPWLRFFDANGDMIAENDDANQSLNSELAVRVLPGRYTVGVRQYSGATNGVIRIGLQRYVPAR